MKKRSMRILGLVWGLIMVAVISSTLTLLFAGKSTSQEASHWVSGSDYERIARYARLDEVRETLLNDYYQELDEDELLLGAIQGMMAAAGDPYTFYYTPEEMARSNENSEGLYHGVGILVQRNKDGYIEVLRVYPDSPAEAAGVRVNDLITAVDGNVISGEDGKTYNDAVEQIRGDVGTQVELTIQRDDKTLKLMVTRADVNVSYADYQIISGDIGYVSIAQFTGDAAERFEEAIDYFKEQNIAGMVIDLRNNPGGLLTEVIQIADSILPEGEIVYIQDREGRRTDYYSDADGYDVPLVVLVNDMSASASEILAVAVQTFDRGTVVGMTTYGKGIVQSLLTFEEDGAGMQLTTASYYGSDGRSIHGVGVTPDIEVALEADHIPLNPDPISDNQLATALKELERLINAEQ